MLWRDCLPRAAGHRSKMGALLVLVTVSGLLHTATAARQLNQATLPTLAGQSTWAPAPQYSQHRIIVAPTNVATAAAAAPAVFGQLPANSQLTSFATSVNPNLAKPPVISSFGGPGAAFQGVGSNANMPVITAKVTNPITVAAPTTATAALPQVPQALQGQGNALPALSTSTSSSSSSSSMDVTSRARLAAAAGAVPSFPMIPRVGTPLLGSGLNSMANSLGNAVTSAAQGAAAAANPASLNPSQLVVVAAAGAQRFMAKDLPKMIQSAVKDPNVQKGVETFLRDLADGKLELPEMPKTLGDVAKQLNLPEEVTQGLSNIKIPENLTKLPDSLKTPQLPKLELPKFNIPGLNNGVSGSKGLNLPQLPQLPGLNQNNNDKLSGTRWTNPPVPKADSRGSTGVYSIDAARFMMGKSDYNPAQPEQHSGELGAGTFQEPDTAAGVAAAEGIKHNQQQQTVALRARDGVTSRVTSTGDTNSAADVASGSNMNSVTSQLAAATPAAAAAATTGNMAPAAVVRPGAPATTGDQSSTAAAAATNPADSNSSSRPAAAEGSSSSSDNSNDATSSTTLKPRSQAGRRFGVKRSAHPRHTAAAAAATDQPAAPATSEVPASTAETVATTPAAPATVAPTAASSTELTAEQLTATPGPALADGAASSSTAAAAAAVTNTDTTADSEGDSSRMRVGRGRRNSRASRDGSSSDASQDSTSSSSSSSSRSSGVAFRVVDGRLVPADN